ncbi:MAG: adenylosuccinate synthetase [Vicingus serpentipes]|nr:adenylosuccinate synthetase [Vicingus serpentipes]
MVVHVVIGAGFGDEGKGHTVNELVSLYKDPLVVRFNGGPQAGHTVIHNGIRHVFSHFGSGTLQGAKTFWSKFCPVEPGAFIQEYNKLNSVGITPEIIVDPLCPIITPFDRYVNQERDNGNGTCGIGVGPCIARTKTTPYKLYVRDLRNKYVFNKKLDSILDYYCSTSKPFLYCDEERQLFEQYAFELHKRITVANKIPSRTKTLIFEGAQGLLLDQEIGFFPHVTRSYTGSQNARVLLAEWGINVYTCFHYVTRPYLTRHGNGPLPYEDEYFLYYLKDEVIQNETNILNKWQGKFRYAPFNLPLLKYAVHADMDRYMNNGKHPTNKFLIKLTCQDHFINEDNIPLILNENKGVEKGNLSKIRSFFI